MARLSKERTKRVEVPNDEDQGFVVIRDLDADVIESIESKTQIIEHTEGDGAKVSFNPYDRETMFVEHCLKDFGNLYDENDNVMKFSGRNVQKSKGLMIPVDDEYIRFFEWVNEERVKFAKEVELEKEEAAKNSKS